MTLTRTLSITVAAALLVGGVAVGPALVGAADGTAETAATAGAVETAATAGAGDSSVQDDPVQDDSAQNSSAKSGPDRMTPDAVVLNVQVHEDGTATWRVTYRTRLGDAETAGAFADYAADVANHSRQYRQQFVDRMARTVRSAEQFTDRRMAATNFSVSAETRTFPERYGVVAYTFEWRGFANVSGDRVRVGDALSGLVLDGKTKLCVEWPDSYEAATVRSEPDATVGDDRHEVVWNGPVEFPDDEPRVVLAASGAGGFDERRSLCEERSL